MVRYARERKISLMMLRLMMPLIADQSRKKKFPCGAAASSRSGVKSNFVRVRVRYYTYIGMHICTYMHELVCNSWIVVCFENKIHTYEDVLREI